MRLICDLHMHGKYSRATSKDLTIPNIEKYARQKGLSLVGTGDAQHPQWFEDIKPILKASDPDSGVYLTQTGFPFILTTEISLVYSQGGRGYRTHNVLLIPSFDAVKKLQAYLLTKGRIDYDGRPIFKIPCPEFVEAMRSIDERIEVIPAHIWTPWFSLFGSKSGFDKIDDCFQDQIKHIHVLESGISSDPAMNWRLSQLDRFRIVSFSDSHSFWPWRMGREATMLDVKELTFQSIINALRTGNGMAGTIETSPNYGKYHFDGHRACGVMLSPQETRQVGKTCPKCKTEMTIGVAYRIEELADRPEGYVRKDHPPFHTLLPLSEIIAAVKGVGLATKGVWQEYYNLQKLGPELDVLMTIPGSELMKVTLPQIAKAIIQIREGRVKYAAGYDGLYGKAILQDDDGNDIELASDAD